jgi:hypothetical protein
MTLAPEQWRQADQAKGQRTGFGNICKGLEFSIRQPTGSSQIDRKTLVLQNSTAAIKLDDGKVARLRHHHAGGEGATSAGNDIPCGKRRFDFQGGPVLATIVRETEYAATGTIGHEAEIEPHACKHARELASGIMAAANYDAGIAWFRTGMQPNGAHHNQDRQGQHTETHHPSTSRLDAKVNAAKYNPGT